MLLVRTLLIRTRDRAMARDLLAVVVPRGTSEKDRDILADGWAGYSGLRANALGAMWGFQ